MQANSPMTPAVSRYSMSALSTPQLGLTYNGKKTSLSPMFIGAIVFCLLSCSSFIYLNFSSGGLNTQKIINEIKPSSSMSTIQTVSWASSCSFCIFSTISMSYVAMKYASNPPAED
jgi:hypothetical protein